MSVFKSKFDLVTEETLAAPGAFAVMLDVARTGASYDANGTWRPGVITAGTIVAVNAEGKAETASHPASGQPAVLPMVVIDGTDTFSGAFTSKVTCLISNFQMKTDQFASAVYTPGQPVSFGNSADGTAGKVVPWATGKQVIGFVGKDGLDNGQLHVVVSNRG